MRPLVVPKPTVSEAVFQKAVLELAHALGWRTAHFHDSRRQIAPGRFVGDQAAAGFPDLVLCRERVVFAELKGPKTRVTDAQLAWGRALGGAGAEWYLWRSADWSEIELVLGGRG